MNADGTGTTQLTNDPADDNDLAWSPDGSRIAFVSDREGTQVWVMDADGSGPTPLTTAKRWHSSPTWSPDGTRIAFVGNFELWVMNADGTGLARLAPGSTVRNPAWSPDGARVAFSGGRRNAALWSTGIYVVPSEGGRATRLTRSRDYSPTWRRR